MKLEKILKCKKWIEVVGSTNILTDYQVYEITKLEDLITNYNLIMMVANFVKYDLTDFEYRFHEIIKTPCAQSHGIYCLRYGDIEGNTRWDSYLVKLKNRPKTKPRDNIFISKPWSDALGSDYYVSDELRSEILSIFDNHENVINTYIIDFIKFGIFDNFLDRYDELIQNPMRKDKEFMILKYGGIEGPIRYKRSAKREGISKIVDSKYFIDEFGDDYILSDTVIVEIEQVIEFVKDHNHVRLIVTFIKYNLDNYLWRFKKILENPNSTSKSQHILRYGEDEGTKRFNDFCSHASLIHSKDHYIEKHGELEGAKIFDDIQKKKLVNIGGFIERDGKELGTKKYKDFCKRNEGNWSKERQIELHGFEIGEKKYDHLKDHVKYSSSLQGYIDKHGQDDGSKLWNKRMDKMHYNTSRHGYIDKYGEVEGLKIMREMKDNTSLDAFIRVHGEDDGPIKYNEWVDKVSKFPGYSQLAQSLFFKISSQINYMDIDVLFACNPHEFHLYNSEIKRRYLYDFTIPSLNYCIEFNGDLWHGNPTIYESTDNPNPFYPNLTSQDIWDKDEIKNQFIKDQGYQLKIIWEKDFHTRTEEIISECVSEITKLYTERQP
jgi:hypothetical protein